MKINPANQVVGWKVDEQGNVFLSLPYLQETPLTTMPPAPALHHAPAPAMFTRAPQPQPSARFRKWDTRMGWLTGGFVLYAACQLVWWIAVAVRSGAVDRAVAQ